MAPWNEQVPGVQVNPQQQVMAQLAKIFQAAQAQRAQAGAGRQSTPPLVPPPVFLPQPGGLPGMSAPMGMPSQAQLPPRQNVTPLNPQVDNFSSKKAARANTVQNFMTGLGDLLTQAKNRKEVHEQRKAEGYFNQIQQALERGEDPKDPNSSLYVLLTDPKVIKTLEKGLDYYMPKEPGEPPPPEAKGLHKVLDFIRGKQAEQAKQLPPPGSPGGIRPPQASQSAQYDRATQDMIAKQRYEALKKDPTLAGQLGIGTGLSSGESRQAELYEKGLAISPVQEAQMTFQQQKALQALQEFQEKNKTELIKIAAMLKGTEARSSATMEAARIRAQATRDVGMAMVDARKLINSGKQNEAYKSIMSTLSSQINTLRRETEQANKDGNKTQAAAFQQQADELQKRYDEVQQSNPDDPINKIIEEILK